MRPTDRARHYASRGWQPHQWQEAYLALLLHEAWSTRQRCYGHYPPSLRHGSSAYTGPSPWSPFNFRMVSSVTLMVNVTGEASPSQFSVVHGTVSIATSMVSVPAAKNLRATSSALQASTSRELWDRARLVHLDLDFIQFHFELSQSSRAKK